jgi:hypothetical protein
METFFHVFLWCALLVSFRRNLYTYIFFVLFCRVDIVHVALLKANNSRPRHAAPCNPIVSALDWPRVCAPVLGDYQIGSPYRYDKSFFKWRITWIKFNFNKPLLWVTSSNKWTLYLISTRTCTYSAWSSWLYEIKLEKKLTKWFLKLIMKSYGFRLPYFVLTPPHFKLVKWR